MSVLLLDTNVVSILFKPDYVWEYFSVRAEQKGVGLSELLTDVLKRDIEINEAMK